jgi:hypothetical protein
MSILPGYLWKKLVIPLAFLSLAFFILALSFPWQGFFVNLTATFIGILATVLYVDYVIQQHEKGRWAQAKALIDKRIDNLANVSASQFRTAFNIGYEVFNQGAMDFDNPSSIRSEMIRVTGDILLPSVDAAIPKLDVEDWKKLERQLRITWEGADRLCSVFGNRIEPEKLSLIMEIQDEIRSILTCYSILPDVIGVPDDKLPTKKIGSAKADKRAMERNISSHVKNVLNKTISLLKKLDE